MDSDRAAVVCHADQQTVYGYRGSYIACVKLRSHDHHERQFDEFDGAAAGVSPSPARTAAPHSNYLPPLMNCAVDGAATEITMSSNPPCLWPVTGDHRCPFSLNLRQSSHQTGVRDLRVIDRTYEYISTACLYILAWWQSI